MFGFGMPEMVIILVIALVVFGPAKLPQLGQSLGAGIRNFKKATIDDDVTLVNKVEGEEKK